MLTEQTAEEAGKILGLPGSATKVKSVIRKKLKRGEWPGRKDGRFWWFDVDEIVTKIRGGDGTSRDAA